MKISNILRYLSYALMGLALYRMYILGDFEGAAFNLLLAILLSIISFEEKE